MDCSQIAFHAKLDLGHYPILLSNVNKETKTKIRDTNTNCTLYATLYYGYLAF